jgi:outer membrane protein TolC
MKSLFIPVFLLCAVLVGSPAQAQDDPPRYEPPLLRPEQQSLSLVDAVRLTLQHDPFILLQEADTLGRAGIARELSGQFDTTMRGDGRFDYIEQELPESVKRQQRKDRQDLIDALPEVETLADSLQAVLANLGDPRITTDPNAVDLTRGITNAQTRIEALTMQTQLILLTELINSAADPNLRQNLIALRQTSIDLMRDQVTRNAREANEVRLDLRNTLADLGDAPVDEWRSHANLHLDVVRQLRNGIIVAPFVDLTYDAQNFKGKPFRETRRGGEGVEDTYRSQVGFDVVLPLLRGRGRTSVAAAETAANIDYQASRLLLLHEKSRGILETARAYWDLRSATEELEVARRSVKLQSDLLSLTQALIKAKEKPRADESRVQASYSDALARQAGAERRLSDARIALARVMGVALDAGTDPAPVATEPFPEPPADLADTTEAILKLAQEAVGLRMDRRAAALREEAAGVLVKGARRDTKPRLDLTGRMFATSTAEKSFGDLNRWVFPSGSGSLEFEAPFGNNFLRGRLAQRESSLLVAQIESTDRERTIMLNVMRLSESLRVAADQVRRAEDAVRFYDKTIEDEQAKLKAGDSTLVDTIFTEQQTTAARDALVLARRDYAALLAELRYEAGLLVTEGPDGGRVSESSLTSVPAPLRGAEPRN